VQDILGRIKWMNARDSKWTPLLKSSVRSLLTSTTDIVELIQYQMAALIDSVQTMVLQEGK
jgi:hypothetical protein